MTDNIAQDSSQTPKKRPGWMAFLPVALFGGLAALFFYSLMLGGDPSKLPSMLIGKPAPEFDLPAIAGLEHESRQIPGLNSAELRNGEVHVVNIWATWCSGCRLEHPVLERFAKMKIAPLVGIGYKDRPAKAVRYLRQYGNPYAAVGNDAKGRTGIDLGVTKLPETFIVDGKGIVRYKHIGPIMPRDLETIIIPEIKKARTGSGEKN